MFKRNLAAAAGALLAVAAPALGVIQVALPVSKVYDSSSLVVSGKVTGLDEQRRIAEVTLDRTYKGETAARVMRIHIDQPAFAGVKQAQPAAILVSRGSAAIHLADEWLLTSPANEEQTLWTTAKSRGNPKQLQQAYPGTTRGLLKLLPEIKGANAILDKADDALLGGGVEKVTHINSKGKPRFIRAVDLDGDGTIDLLVGHDDGMRIIWGSNQAREAALLPHLAAAKHIAAGDANGDGRVDLLCDGELKLGGRDRMAPPLKIMEKRPADVPAVDAIVDVNGDGRADVVSVVGGAIETRLQPDKIEGMWEVRTQAVVQTVVGAAIGDFGEDGKPHAIVVSEHGINRFPLAADGPPADFARLTGEDLAKFDPESIGFKHAATVTLDANGDGRTDILILTRAGGILLINRGYGAFFASTAAPAALHQGGKSALPHIAPDLVWCGAKLGEGGQEDLVIVTAEGEVLRVKNK